MKLCPLCRSTYADETLRFCLQDGSPLLDGSGGETESPTVSFDRILPDSNVDTAEQLTNISPHRTYTTNKDADQMRVEIPSSKPEPEPPTAIITNTTSVSSGSRTLLAVLGTIIVMLVIFGAGLGAWSYLQTRSDDKQNADQSDIKAGNSPARTATPEQRVVSQKSTTPESNVAAERPTPESEPDSEDVEKAVARQVDSWKSFAEARNLESYMNVYADRIDYYNKKGASRAFVRGDKLKAFTKYDSISITLTNITITPDNSGAGATTVFDKAWLFQNQSQTSEGKVKTQLRLVSIGGVWKITGERDLKVYYVK